MVESKKAADASSCPLSQKKDLTCDKKKEVMSTEIVKTFQEGTAKDSSIQTQLEEEQTSKALMYL